MRIEISEQEFMQMAREVCEYMPTDTITFKIIDDKVKRIQARQDYIKKNITPYAE